MSTQTLINTIPQSPLSVSGGSIVINAENISSFPKFSTVGWGWKNGVSASAPCFGYALNDSQMCSVMPGSGHQKLRDHMAALSNLIHPQRMTSLSAEDIKAPTLEMSEYAAKKFAQIIDDGMVAIAPEDGFLNVPAGTCPLLLTVFKIRSANTALEQPAKYGQHWFRANQPASPEKPIVWSHWDGGDFPKNFSHLGTLTDPWNQCAFESPSYTPVSYFLAPEYNGPH